jgi:predicted neuraminidase
VRLLAIPLIGVCVLSAQNPFLESEFIFPQEKLHNHASMIVELPGGELFTVWYRGSGERTADDVAIMYSRKQRGRAWTPLRVLADTPNFPDCNPAVFVDREKRLWLTWPAIIANQWETALLKYRVSSDYKDEPVWNVFSDDILFIPRNFEKKSLEGIAAMKQQGIPARYTDGLEAHAKDKYFSRMGWMPRAHPVQLKSGRILIPLYSDGYSYSIMAITDDAGRTWSSSEPLVGAGSIQPSIAQKRNGTLVAYMRDNGPPPKRLHVSESTDAGITWSQVRDTEIPNPGSGAEVITLSNGDWALIYNDTEKGRNSLAVSLSEDEGKTWKYTRHLEKKDAGSYHYPSLVEAKDGTLHSTYSYFDGNGKTIKHAHFNVHWIKQGDTN